MLDVPVGSALAFDFGEVRIGVAQGNSQLGITHPIATITGNSNHEKFAAIAGLVSLWQPEYLVVGLPVHADGTEHRLTALSRKFGYRLNARFALPVYWADERYSSIYAEELLQQAQVFGRRSKVVLDQVAAQAVLQNFFENGGVGVFTG